jgi:hypothetical protein
MSRAHCCALAQQGHTIGQSIYDVVWWHK